MTLREDKYEMDQKLYFILFYTFAFLRLQFNSLFSNYSKSYWVVNNFLNKYKLLFSGCRLLHSRSLILRKKNPAILLAGLLLL